MLKLLATALLLFSPSAHADLAHDCDDIINITRTSASQAYGKFSGGSPSLVESYLNDIALPVKIYHVEERSGSGGSWEHLGFVEYVELSDTFITRHGFLALYFVRRPAPSSEQMFFAGANAANPNSSADGRPYDEWHPGELYLSAKMTTSFEEMLAAVKRISTSSFLGVSFNVLSWDQSKHEVMWNNGHVARDMFRELTFKSQLAATGLFDKVSEQGGVQFVTHGGRLRSTLVLEKTIPALPPSPGDADKLR